MRGFWVHIRRRIDRITFDPVAGAANQSQVGEEIGVSADFHGINVRPPVMATVCPVM